MKKRLLVTILPALLMSGCAWFNLDEPGDESIAETVTDTEQASQDFLAGRALEVVEGAWVHDGGAFELVITRNDFGIAPEFDYLGIVTRSSQPKWSEGDVKLLIRQAGADGTYEGIWLTRFKSPTRMTFVVEHRGLIQGHHVSRDGNAYFARVRRIGPATPVDFAVLEETDQLMALLAEFRR